MENKKVFGMEIVVLKNCPFCGGEAELHQDNNPPCDDWWVACYNTDCPSNPQVNPYYHHTRGRETAIKAWNTRKEISVEDCDQCKKDHEILVNTILNKFLSIERLEEIIFKTVGKDYFANKLAKAIKAELGGM